LPITGLAGDGQSIDIGAMSPEVKVKNTNGSSPNSRHLWAVSGSPQPFGAHAQDQPGQGRNREQRIMLLLRMGAGRYVSRSMLHFD
jgi:hypothetical protein